MVQIEELGPASLGFPFNGAALAGARLVVSSRNLAPARLGVWDLDTGAVTQGPVVPTGAGAWGMTAVGEQVYVGQTGARGRDALYRYDLATGALTALAVLDANYVWALAAAPTGVVYGVTGAREGAPDQVIAHDPATGGVRDLGLTAPGEGLRAITVSVAPGGDPAAGYGVVYGGGVAGGALLRALRVGPDGAAGEHRSVLPPKLGAHRTVYALAAGAGAVAVGTQGPDLTRPAVAVLDAASLGATVLTRLSGESLVDAVAVAGDAVYATARPSGALYRVDRATGAATRLAVPVTGAETRALFVRAGTGAGGAGEVVVGVSAAERVWTWDVAAGSLTVVSLLERGLEPGPERCQSLSAAGGTVAAGGNFGLQVRRVADRATRRWFVPGEPKDQAVAGATRYLALYPVAQLWAAGVDLDSPPQLVAQLPAEQNRPVCLHHDAATGLVCCGTASDTLGGGGLHLYAPADRTVHSVTNPLGPGQYVARIASADGVAYLAGGSGDPDLVAYDLAGRAERWRTPLGAGVGTVTGLVPLGRRLHCLTERGWLLTVDLDARAVVASARVSSSGGRMLAYPGPEGGERLAAVDADALADVDPASGAWTVVLAGLAPQVWGNPFLAVDADAGGAGGAGGAARFVVRGTDLLRVTGP